MYSNFHCMPNQNEHISVYRSPLELSTCHFKDRFTMTQFCHVPPHLGRLPNTIIYFIYEIFVKIFQLIAKKIYRNTSRTIHKSVSHPLDFFHLSWGEIDAANYFGICPAFIKWSLGRFVCSKA